MMKRRRYNEGRGEERRNIYNKQENKKDNGGGEGCSIQGYARQLGEQRKDRISLEQ